MAARLSATGWLVSGRDETGTISLRSGFGVRASNIGMPDSGGSKLTGEHFERIVLPHLNAAYNLARWLVRNPQDAEDIVQEAYLRAFKFWSGYQGGDARAWLLKIVRNTSYSFLERKRPADQGEE